MNQTMPSRRGGKREAGPGKKIGRPQGSRNKPRVYVACWGTRELRALVRLKVPVMALDPEVGIVRIGKARTYRSERLNIHEALVLHRYLQTGLDREDAFASTGANRGGKREPGPGKKLGRPSNSTKLLAMAAALTGCVPKSPL
jgi:hypothetical protein